MSVGSLAASTPFGADTDCLSLAMRMIKEGAPEFADQQMINIFKSKEGTDDWMKIEQCKKKRPEPLKAGEPTHKTGLDFGCFAKEFIPNEFNDLTKCWQSHRDHSECLTEIYTACDALHAKWSTILLRGSQSS